MTMKRMLLGASGVTPLCYAMVLVNKAVGPVLDGAFRLLLPLCRRNPA
ncbi:MAG: hypothetical protein ACI4MP_08050 [Candidatus Ventricola sp.]